MRVILLLALCVAVMGRSFGFANQTLLKDGKPFRLLSGSFHYFRIHPAQWADRMLKYKEGGLNAIQVYFPWNWHEQSQGAIDFSSPARDIEKLMQMAASMDLLVIARPGPYVCAEFDFGGFPHWLLAHDPPLRLRTSDPAYLALVDAWEGRLLPILAKYKYSRGGPIVSFQIENEYGFTSLCDVAYLRHLKSLFRTHLGEDAMLHTTDPWYVLECGSLPDEDVLTTVDFGADTPPATAFGDLRRYKPDVPAMNSEFYTGWLDHVGEGHERKAAGVIDEALQAILATPGASVNHYMWEGGTNFGFWNGANANHSSEDFHPQPTSYDYDAPLSEAGDMTPKWLALRRTLLLAQGADPDAPVSARNSSKAALGRVVLHRQYGVLDCLAAIARPQPVESPLPVSFEALGQAFGYIVYSAALPRTARGRTVSVQLPPPRDRVHLFADATPMGSLTRGENARTKNGTQIRVAVPPTAEKLVLVVENMGRVNFGPWLNDPKGILGNVTVDGETVLGWTHHQLDFAEPFAAPPCPGAPEGGAGAGAPWQPALFSGKLTVPATAVGSDTFLRLPGWTRGLLFVNGHNLGRYDATGPQLTYYVPAPVLREGDNDVLLAEFEGAPDALVAESVAVPEWM